MRKIAHYYYGGGKQLQVFVEKRKYYVRDETGDFPPDPTTGLRQAHPDDGGEYLSADYETLGLYYEYAMPDTGWSGDC